SIASANDVYDIEATGELTTETISIDGKLYATGKSFDIKSDLEYDDIKKVVTIRPSLLQLKKSLFTVSGNYAWKERNMIDLKAEGKETDIQTLLSLLPERSATTLEKYRSKGDVYFKGKLQGEISKQNAPSVSVDFGFTDATLFHPDYKSQIKEASMTGSFASNKVTDPKQATLVLKDMKGTLNGEPFVASLVIANFDNPEVICSFKGKVDAAALSEFYPIEHIKNVSGDLFADVSLE